MGRLAGRSCARCSLAGTFWRDDVALCRCNEGLAPVEAGTVLQQLCDHGLAYCEEPLPIELVREQATLRAQGIMPLIADDSCFSARDLARELALDTFDILNIKTARTGYSESQAMLARSLAASKGIADWLPSQRRLGHLRAAFFAGRPGIDHPSELSFFLKVKEDILTAPIPLHEGYLRLTDLADITVDRTLLAAAVA
ncbi:MAG: enolase C-terminal domain-like protein [Caldilineaceae bacterium]